MNYYGVTRSSEYLAHYGIKGMKWGVRKAKYYGNDKSLERHYRKAARKLAKLERIGNDPGRYAKKAAAYGVAAAGTGTIAIGGTKKLSGITRTGLRKLSDLTRSQALGTAAYKNATAISRWGRHDSKINNPFEYVTKKVQAKNNKGQALFDKSGNAVMQDVPVIDPYSKKPIHTKLTNDSLVRLGAGAVTVGLGAKALQNAYRATHAKKYRAKAHEFRNEMNEAFTGTRFEGMNGMPLPKKKKKRR